MMAGAGTSNQILTARHFPTRTCVACRTTRQKRDLVRIVRAPDGAVSLDLSGRAAGRGAYICADGSCWAAALKRKSIERALSAPLPPDLRKHLEAGHSDAATHAGGDAHGPQ